MFTQIYSIQTAEEAFACIEAGADRIGVLVGIPGGNFPCAINEETAGEIFKAIGGSAVKVLISVESQEEEVLSQAGRLKPDVLHLCANFCGSPHFRKRMRNSLPGMLLMEAVGVSGQESIAEAKRKEAYADILILDSISPSVPGVGAAGVVHDWNIDRQIVDSVSIPVILAGGLGPDNVVEAIRAVRPDGVDSLTKTSILEDGRLIAKDIALVREFCSKAKAQNEKVR